jgi:crotonobetainyl-CoA:carnitine CoA-transferase CaiB-like acyl-CoA transferase
MDGVRVLEVAAWTFVPAAGAVLADWGADVIKVEHPVSGDPQRGLITSGLIPGGPGAVNYIIEQPNRGKRSIGIDIATDEGRALLYKLAETSDVFLTNFLPQVRQKLQIDVEHIRAVNPNIVYARGSGQGVRGPDAEKGGYDGASYWARGGIANALTPADSEWPIGEAPVVDVSLLGFAMWTLSPDIVASKLYGGDPLPKFDRKRAPNPLVGNYRTKDDRYLMLMMLQADRFWEDFCTNLGQPELATDARFADGLSRYENRGELVQLLDDTFASKTLAEWRDAFADMKGVWAPVQTALELHDDPQTLANGYISQVERDDGVTFPLVTNPVQFDEQQVTLTAAPEHGQHTEEILLELGYSWEDIIAHKESGAIL